MHSTLCTQVQCISKGQAQAISHTYPSACMVLCTCSKLEFQKNTYPVHTKHALSEYSTCSDTSLQYLSF